MILCCVIDKGLRYPKIKEFREHVVHTIHVDVVKKKRRNFNFRNLQSTYLDFGRLEVDVAENIDLVEFLALLSTPLPTECIVLRYSDSEPAVLLFLEKLFPR